MLPPDQSQKALRRFFRRHRVGQLADLYQVLQTHSRMSVFRRLNLVGYCSSFTHGGRYYTLAELPQFDPWGLWFHRQVGFSQAVTLKATVLKLVGESEAGMAPKELRALLKLPVSNTLYNTLHELVRAAQLQPQKLAGRALYFSIDSQRATEQFAHRELVQRQTLVPLESVPAETVIEVLVEALQAADVLGQATTIASRLRVRQVSVTADQVAQIFAHYGLQPGKKTAAPASKPSRS